MQAAARPDKLLVNQTITFLLCDYEAMITRPGAKPDITYDNRSEDRGWFSEGPDYAREATWLVMSQRPDVLSYYESGLNEFTNPRIDPIATSPATLSAIGDVCQRLIKPYGPTLLDSQRFQPEVALLASATGVWFHAGSVNWGWMNEQTLPYAGLLMMNHVPFDVILDDDLIEGKIDRYKVLVLPFSATVTQKMADQLQKFIAAGGRVIANHPFRLELDGVIRTRYDFTFEWTRAVIRLPKTSSRPTSIVDVWSSTRVTSGGISMASPSSCKSMALLTMACEC
jgi:hypothetical protein